MRVTIKTVESYEVSVNGQKIGTFQKGGDWNGMTELINARGKVIIADPEQPLREVFSIFGASPSKEREVECVMASPGLFPATKQENAKPVESEESHEST